MFSRNESNDASADMGLMNGVINDEYIAVVDLMQYETQIEKTIIKPLTAPKGPKLQYATPRPLDTDDAVHQFLEENRVNF